jgi:hypothetical protein
MNVKELIIAQLKAMGADGLVCPDEDCGCGIDDFAPCDCPSLTECEAATLCKTDGLYYRMEAKR